MAENREAQVEAAVQQSFFRQLSPELLSRLLERSHVVDIPPGALVYRQGDPAGWALLVSGLIRIFVRSAEGRQLTIRYFRPGDVLGMATTISGSMSMAAQAVSRVALLYLDSRELRKLVEDGDGAWILLQQLASRLNETIDELAANAFSTVRGRLARHLLDLAVPRGQLLLVEAGHQELADSMASVREVVQRALRDLARDSIVRLTPSSVVILSAERLYAAARPPN